MKKQEFGFDSMMNTNNFTTTNKTPAYTPNINVSKPSGGTSSYAPNLNPTSSYGNTLNTASPPGTKTYNINTSPSYSPSLTPKLAPIQESGTIIMTKTSSARKTNFSDSCLQKLCDKLMTVYNSSGSGILNDVELGTLMRDSYGNTNSNLTNKDLGQFKDIFGSGGKVSREDLLRALTKYLGGGGSTGFNFYSMSKKDKIMMEALKTLSREEIEKELSQARTLFLKYDSDGSHRLTKEEVRPMMVDTYKQMGQEFNPTDQEVIDYIRMMDVSGDDEVTLEEYEIFVLNALKQRNMSY